MIESDYLKDNNEIIQKLMRIPALKSFNEENMQTLLHMSKIKEFKTGDLIFEEGSYANLIYYIIFGKARIVKDGKELIILQRTGDVFGEMGPIDGSSRSASVYAADDTVCVEIDISSLDKMSGDDMYSFRYMIFRGFAEILANRLRVTTDELLHARNEIAELRSLIKKD